MEAFPAVADVEQRAMLLPALSRPAGSLGSPGICSVEQVTHRPWEGTQAGVMRQKVFSS